MEDIKIKTKTGEEITLSPMPEGGLAGDVLVRPLDDEEYPGITLGGGLSGSVVFPGAINKPEDLPKTPEMPLGGLIMPPWEVENGLMELLEIKRILKEAAKNNLISEERLKELIKALDERYTWNKEYIDDQTISADDKVQDVENVVDGNLKRIRDYTTMYQSDLDAHKGNTL